MSYKTLLAAFIDTFFILEIISNNFSIVEYRPKNITVDKADLLTSIMAQL